MPNSLERRHSRRRRHERTRQELIQAALDQAVAGSFKDLTVEGVTREAGVSRSAFYVYFGDKEELLLGALEDLIASHRNRLGNCWPRGGDPRRGVEKAIYDVARIFSDNSDLLVPAFEAATYDEEVREIWAGLTESVTEGTADQIRRLQAEGAVDDSLDAGVVAEGLVLMTERSFQLNLAQGDREPKSVAADLTKVWWAALFGAGGAGPSPGERARSGEVPVEPDPDDPAGADTDPDRDEAADRDSAADRDDPGGATEPEPVS
ncbi:MAG: TetR/AcrR family transcriptional regulator [Acidobacteriota bacterium]